MIAPDHVLVQHNHVAVPEPISKLSEEDNEAGELDEAEKVLGVEFPADEYAALPLYRRRNARRASVA
jgi:hypothetical protein